MAQQRESALQRRVQKAIRAHWRGAYVRKIHVSEFQSEGMPDLICCIAGYFIAVEVKTDDGTPSRMQLLEREEIRRAGGCALIVRTPEQAIIQITNFLRGTD
jgi:Holliday junction resolvase